MLPGKQKLSWTGRIISVIRLKIAGVLVTPERLRVFHQKFGYGRVTFVEGNKLTVNFDKAGEKRVIDQFVSRA